MDDDDGKDDSLRAELIASLAFRFIKFHLFGSPIPKGRAKSLFSCVSVSMLIDDLNW